MSEPLTNRYRNVLDKGTLVPLGVVVSCCLCLFGGWQYLDSRFDSLEDTMRDQGREMRQLNEEITRDRWTRTDHRLWVAELRRMNPSLPVPTVPAKESPK